MLIKDSCKDDICCQRSWRQCRYLLLLIKIGNVYFIILIIIALVSISLVLALEYLKTSFSTDNRKLTLDIILFTVALLERPEAINIPSTFILDDCLIIYLLACSTIFDIELEY